MPHIKGHVQKHTLSLELEMPMDHIKVPGLFLILTPNSDFLLEQTLKRRSLKLWLAGSHVGACTAAQLLTLMLAQSLPQRTGALRRIMQYFTDMPSAFCSKWCSWNWFVLNSHISKLYVILLYD